METLGSRLQPRRYGKVNWVGLNTLLSREVKRFLKVSAQTVMAPMMTTLMFMSVFALAFGARGSGFPGVSYADFIAPGLIMMGMINNAFANSSSSLMIAKLQGNAVDFLMPPLSAGELTAAFLGGAVVRGLIVGAASLAVVAALADVSPAHAGAVLYFALAACTIFAAIGLIGGIWAEKFDHLAAVTNFVIMPLTFLSGTFYSVDLLPGPLAAISHWNPVFLLIDGFRYGFIGHADGEGAVWRAALVSGALAAALTGACWALLRSGWRLRA